MRGRLIYWPAGVAFRLAASNWPYTNHAISFTFPSSSAAPNCLPPQIWVLYVMDEPVGVNWRGWQQWVETLILHTSTAALPPSTSCWLWVTQWQVIGGRGRNGEKCPFCLHSLASAVLAGEGQDDHSRPFISIAIPSLSNLYFKNKSSSPLFYFIYKKALVGRYVQLSI